MNNMPQYIRDIVSKLEAEYGDIYHTAYMDEYMVFDFIRINHIPIIIERLDEDYLSEDDIRTLYFHIKRLYMGLNNRSN